MKLLLFNLSRRLKPKPAMRMKTAPSLWMNESLDGGNWGGGFARTLSRHTLMCMILQQLQNSLEFSFKKTSGKLTAEDIQEIVAMQTGLVAWVFFPCFAKLTNIWWFDCHCLWDILRSRWLSSQGCLAAWLRNPSGEDVNGRSPAPLEPWGCSWCSRGYIWRDYSIRLWMVGCVRSVWDTAGGSVRRSCTSA